MSEPTPRRRLVLRPGAAGPLLLAGLLCAGHGTALPAAAPLADHEGAGSFDVSRLRWEGERALAPAPGGAVELTLDRGLHRAAVELLAGARPRAGAVVAVDLRRGSVLAFAERRAPGGVSPLLGGTAPSASVFKLVTTASLLEAGVSVDTRVCAPIARRRIDRRHLDDVRSGERCARFGEALGHSHNAVYARLATERLSRAELTGMAERFGLNRPVPFDLPVTAGRFAAPVGDLEFARAATGFREAELSPLGALQLSTIVASDGWRRRFHLVAPPAGAPPAARPDRVDRAVSADVARRLARMMELTVASGTAASAFRDEHGRPYLGALHVAGKTGTLTTGEITHSWFTGFAPARNPKVAVVVLLENGPVWHRRAAEVARDVLREYFAARGYRGVTFPRSEARTEPVEAVARKARALR